MKMRRQWWYVIALVLIVLAVMAFFKDDIGLAPSKGSQHVSNAEVSQWAADTFGDTSTDRNAQALLQELQKAARGSR